MKSDFEMLLEQSENLIQKNEYNDFGKMKYGVHDSQKLRADKSATMHDFIKMIDKIITTTMKEDNVIFIPDEGKVPYLSTDQPLDQNMITYKIIDRVPKNELKPRIRETFADGEEYDRSLYEVYGQKFKCHIQFNIFCSVYTQAEKVMEKFEEMMLTYAGYFKKNGVGEIIFDKQYTDDHFEAMRQTLSVRNICYYVETEKLTVIRKQSIHNIDTY